MWRSFFLAIGFFVLILGVECLGVDHVILRLHHPAPPSLLDFDNVPRLGPNKEFFPPPWAPWSLLSTGTVMCLYSFTIPRRVAGG